MDSVRTVLKRWGGVIEYCGRLQRELNDIELLIDGVRGITARKMDGMPKASGKSDSTALKAEKAIELEKEYEQASRRLIERISEELRFKSAVDGVVDGLSDKHRGVIELRFKQGIVWHDVARRLEYSEAHVKRIEKQAIELLEKQIEVAKID